MTHYIAAFHTMDNGHYGVSFPDFPGCVSTGRGIDDAIRNAAEALALHVAGMREDGDVLPNPSSPENLHAAIASGAEGAFLASVPLLPDPGETVRIQVTLDSQLLSQIDAVTKNRSAFLADAAAARLGKS